MTRDQFDTLVARLEPYAQARPRAYRRSVGGLALLGYAYVLLMLTLLLGALAGLVWLVLLHPRGGTIHLGVKLALVLGVLVFMIVRALWVRIPPPDGVRLSREDAPALFERIERLRRARGAPRLHAVLLSADFNACVAQVPRLGVLGWHRQYLVLGLPLLDALTPAQVEAVLAHEFAHLSGQHGRFGAWIYRVRQTWGQLLAQLEAGGQRGAWLFTVFFNWYAPYFNAYSFVFARAQEFEADAAAARGTSAAALTGALVRLHLAGRWLNECYWRGVYDTVARVPAPPPGVLETLAVAVHAAPAPAEGDRWLRQALAERTDRADTHPCLRARLEAIGAAAPAAEAADAGAATASDEFLKNGANALRQRVEQAWVAQVTSAWAARHAETQQARARLATLAARQPDTLDTTERWEHAELLAEHGEPGQAQAALAAFLAQWPDHAGAHFLLGRLLLSRQDDAGLAHLEHAMAADADLVFAVCELAGNYLHAHDREQEAQALRERAEAHGDVCEAAQRERGDVGNRDELLQHGLPPEPVAALACQVATHPAIRRAWLARKAVKTLPEKPLYVLAVERHVPWYKLQQGDADHELLNRLTNNVVFPGETFVVVLNRRTAGLGQRIRTLADACIYQRTSG